MVGVAPLLLVWLSNNKCIEASVVEVHGRRYNLPKKPTVVVCVDGFNPEYLQHGVANGLLPNFARILHVGWATTAHCAMPSFTNPNNVSIITGAPTSKHGISGNYFLDKATGKESMVQDDSLLRGTTILEQLSSKGVRIAAITAKDKLRKILAHGLAPQNGAICFSAEKANECTDCVNGISSVEQWVGWKAPGQYSGDLSLFVLDAGVKLLEEDRADVFYLTLSDFIQHHHAPGEKESDEFMARLDAKIGRLIDLGAVVAVTGDHGMSEKTREDGLPNVLFLEDELNQRFGQNFARVVCPITDPFVKHHGALGSFVRVHLRAETDDPKGVLEFCGTLDQVEVALDGETAAQKFEMPLDQEGDFVVIAKKHAVIGSRQDEHDLAALAGHRLRSHGGLSEQDIPLMLSVPFEGQRHGHQWRNFDVFDVALNYNGYSLV